MEASPNSMQNQETTKHSGLPQEETGECVQDAVCSAADDANTDALIMNF